MGAFLFMQSVGQSKIASKFNHLFLAGPHPLSRADPSMQFNWLNIFYSEEKKIGHGIQRDNALSKI